MFWLTVVCLLALSFLPRYFAYRHTVGLLYGFGDEDCTRNLYVYATLEQLPGGVITPNFPPGQILIGKALRLIFPTAPYILRSINLVVGTLTPLLWLLIFWRKRREIAVAAGVASALPPSMVLLSVIGRAEALCFFLVLGSLMLIVFAMEWAEQKRKVKWRASMVGGMVLFNLLCLTRFEYWVLAPVLLVYIFRHARRLLPWSLLSLVGPLWWLFTMKTRFGNFFASTNLVHFADKYNLRLFFKSLFINAQDNMNFLLLILSLIGLIWLLRKKHFSLIAWSGVALTGFLYFSMWSRISLYDSKYFYSTFFWLFGFAGVGLGVVWNAGHRFLGRKPSFEMQTNVGTVAIVFLISVLSFFNLFFFSSTWFIDNNVTQSPTYFRSCRQLTDHLSELQAGEAPGTKIFSAVNHVCQHYMSAYSDVNLKQNLFDAGVVPDATVLDQFNFSFPSGPEGKQKKLFNDVRFIVTEVGPGQSFVDDLIDQDVLFDRPIRLHEEIGFYRIYRLE